MVLLFTEATTTPTTVPPDFDGMNENYVKDTIVLTLNIECLNMFQFVL